MIIETKLLGYVEVEDGNIIRFPSGIYGFDGVSRFALLTNKNSDNPFIWLQCADKKEPCFVVADPKRLFADYDPDITPAMLESVELDSADALRLLVIATIESGYKRIYFNLKCPIIINSVKNIAAQVILEDDKYPMRYLVSKEAEG